ncbi:MAG: radical SAM family heme chaperone HemW [Paraglaciecola sp.]|uniref:radical SAM family heme chaperone HemW n=1 Tax=Paraglaciecola sp. TaxID=1920173 RepID=UPI00273DAF45|nr:radical SAM family heme chaperone HemW [Paraglaciecola sp.]MDP5032487.1 radical SAM family heme chaperone HemW [Paraglaciecola sp.]MDP5133470.1 radical SAM family heme chaperone HemW [Paraglaciecola sp.]
MLNTTIQTPSLQLPPLSLYIHIPWCVQKCPYCDFNSHGQKQHVLPEAEYVSHLLADLSTDALLIGDRAIHSIFIGGGTPSLFSAQAIDKLLAGVRQRVNVRPDAEITLEANPGTVESQRFADYVQAGINRISIGVQSFQADKLLDLGRIHDDEQARKAAKIARSVGLNSFNIDLMHGLPKQHLVDALFDIQQAIEQQPPHLSWYQLTIEPNTQFHSKPPKLPQDELLWDIQEQGHALLEAAGYEQYEISAYSKKGQQCQHNLNYWRFGDYLGIGCGAHGKITHADNNQILRTVKVKHPKGYMDLTKAYTVSSHAVEPSDLPFEFFMNRLRLVEACPKADYTRYTGLAITPDVQDNLDKAIQKGLLSETPSHWQVTPLGRRYLNTLLEVLV